MARSSMEMKLRSQSKGQLTPLAELRAPLTSATPTSRYERLRRQVGFVVDHPACVTFIIMVIFVDTTLSIMEFADESAAVGTTKTFFVTAITLVSILALELILRMFAETPKIYLRSPWNLFELTIVIASVVLTIVVRGLTVAPARAIRPFMRIVRVLRAGVKLSTQSERMKRAARKQVGMNKQRYKKDGFDLDLCYITDRVIAMSLPAEKVESFYRNPINQVARFLDTKHPNAFMVHNLCSERNYAAARFHNRVVRWPIDDHSVPTLAKMMEFCENVQAFMNKDAHNIIAVHCKGGKGRTGTMICSWLLWDSDLTSAEALDLFQNKRTDSSIPGKKQGVETASQVRYVRYFERVARARKLPLPITLRITSVWIGPLPFIENKENILFNIEMPTPIDCKTSVEPPAVGDDSITWKCHDLRVAKDVNFQAYRVDDKGNKWMIFSFWFHTSYIEQNYIAISKKEVDKVKGQKTAKILADNFQVKLTFQESV